MHMFTFEGESKKTPIKLDLESSWQIKSPPLVLASTFYKGVGAHAVINHSKKPHIMDA